MEENKYIDPNNNKGKSPKTVLLIGGAVAILAVLSFLPWDEWTNGKISNFSLIQDIKSSVADTNDIDTEDAADIDPALLAAMNDSSSTSASTSVSTNSSQLNDTIVPQPIPNKEGEMVIIEDYTEGSRGLSRLKAAINSPKLARIAVIGDSYIEGDIMTQNLRENLQKAYGGNGVGYVNMYSEFPGFRRSVKQSGSGWTEHAASKKGDKKYLALSEHYYTPKGSNATAGYKGVKALSNLDRWQKSQLLFIAPQSTTINIRTNGKEWTEHSVAGSPSVQAIVINEPTDNFEVKSSDPSTVFLGTWLDGNNGISVDCMSSRGYSGITLTSVSADLCREMAKYVDYDLIILEFGINAMSAKQKDYSVYASRLEKVVNHVRKCYPNADILLMGIGDRGEKRNGEIHSMTSVSYMIDAQRTAARNARCLFWDTREAMGEEDAIVKWSKTGLANKDYIHLTHKGGAKLAEPLFNAIQKMLAK